MHGCGGVGLSAVMIAAALGARVVAVDVSDAALKRACDLGAEPVVHAGRDPDAAAAIREIADGGTGAGALRRRARLAGRWPWPRCAACAAVAGTSRSACCSAPAPRRCRWTWSSARELEIYGSHGMAARGYPAMLGMVTDGTLRPALLTGHVIGLEGVARPWPRWTARAPRPG